MKKKTLTKRQTDQVRSIHPPADLVAKIAEAEHVTDSDGNVIKDTTA